MILQQGGPSSVHLQRANIYISNIDACRKQYKKIGLYVYDTQVCAYDATVDRGSCHVSSPQESHFFTRSISSTHFRYVFRSKQLPESWNATKLARVHCESCSDNNSVDLETNSADLTCVTFREIPILQRRK